uniref:Uncharacterized protein n=1 Tax=Globodera rostochiensis TaxID=31243 RepID=A0A914HDF8_GLORO
MSSSNNRQQIYYQGRHHQQQSQQNRIGGLSLSSTHHQMGPASPHQDHHQVVVVSGSGSCTGCVADYHSSCGCPSCESKNLATLGHETSLSDHDQQMYSYMDQGQLDDDDEGIVHEFTTDSGERHVVIMTKTDEQQQEGVISLQERVRRQKLSEAARSRYAQLSEDEKRAVTERRIIMRQRRKQKEREMEELEAILRASNDITDDLVPMDESMNMDERREYNQKRRLRQLGLPENINELEPNKLEGIRRHIADVNARKAEAARQRYHRMAHDERKTYNRRRTESFRKRRVEEEKLLSTPAGQITPEALEKAQNIMIRNAKRAEQARLRYQRKQQEKGIMPRRQRKPKIEYRPSSGEPNLDRILDTIERDVIEPKKEDMAEHEQMFTPPADSSNTMPQVLHVPHSGQNVVQYVQVPAQGVQNGLILTESKFMPSDSSEAKSSSHAPYTLDNSVQKFERGVGSASSSNNYYPVSIIQHEWPQRTSVVGSHHQLQSMGRPARIEIVQPTIISTSQGNFNQQQTHHYTIQLDQNQSTSQHRLLPSSSRNLQSGRASPADEKVMVQRAKRAERARRRYHEMTAEARHEFNAKRAHALKMARLRDEELCRLGDDLHSKGEEPDQTLCLAIEQARMRRAKRAEAARIKYQKMTGEQRKAHNAMRDAQRRQRKREMEDTVTFILLCWLGKFPHGAKRPAKETYSLDVSMVFNRKERLQISKKIGKQQQRGGGGGRRLSNQKVNWRLLNSEKRKQREKQTIEEFEERLNDGTKTEENGREEEAGLKANEPNSSATDSQSWGATTTTETPRYSLTVALPGTILDNVQTVELKTYLSGELARTLAIFCVEEVVVFDETAAMSQKDVDAYRDWTGGSEQLDARSSESVFFMARILEFQECPQYLRKALFRIQRPLKFSALLNPLNALHHLRSNELHSPFREGVVLDRKSNKGLLCDVGLEKELLLKTDDQIEPFSRVTVRIDQQQQKSSKKLRGSLANARTVREETGTYWGYSVRLARSLSQVLVDGSYDAIVGTSERGMPIGELSIPRESDSNCKILVVFGGLSGLEAAMDADPSIQETEPVKYFQHYVNCLPGQGSRVIRTEEAIPIALTALKYKLDWA